MEKVDLESKIIKKEILQKKEKGIALNTSGSFQQTPKNGNAAQERFINIEHVTLILKLSILNILQCDMKASGRWLTF